MDSSVRMPESATLYDDALSLFDNSTLDEQKAFARNLVDVVGRDAIESGRTEQRIQDGLIYDLDTDALLEEWLDSIVGWDLQAPSQTMSQMVAIHIECHTIDIAHLGAKGAHLSAAGPQFEPSLCSEHQLHVDCYFEMDINLSPMMLDDRSRITVVAME